MEDNSSDTVPLTSVEVDSDDAASQSGARSSVGKSVTIDTNFLPSHSRAPSASAQLETPFFVKAERNLFYLKDQLEQFFASRTGPGSSAFVPFVCGTVLVLYFVNVLTKPALDTHSVEEDPAFVQNSALLVKWFTVTPGGLRVGERVRK